MDPDDDPLCILLLLDFYALRSEQYDFVVRMFTEWESHRNLSQLPNFAFSTPLAMFHQSIRDGTDQHKADDMVTVLYWNDSLHKMTIYDNVTLNTASDYRANRLWTK